MITEYVYSIKINALNLKQKISFLLPHFFNPSADVLLFTLAFDQSGMIPIIMPFKNIQVSKYITFLGKNNERFLKTEIIEFLFPKRLSIKLNVLFFLIENNELKFSFSEILKEIEKLTKETNWNLESNAMKHLVEHFKFVLKTNLKKMNCESICLLDYSIPLSKVEKGYNWELTNDFVVLDLVFEEYIK
jgi:hypothetical protein